MKKEIVFWIFLIGLTVIGLFCWWNTFNIPLWIMACGFTVAILLICVGEYRGLYLDYDVLSAFLLIYISAHIWGIVYYSCLLMGK